VRTWEFPKPAKGIEKVAKLKGGLKEYHCTYMKYGGVYRHHRNSRKTDPKTGKPFEKQGEIVAERYNEPMHRGELILKLPDTKWGDVIEKLAEGNPVCWSMGSAVPVDICSNCGHASRSRKEYCDCLRYSLNKIAEDGSVTFALNDETYYHDISEVGTNPAMKIAYTLEKVASGNNVPRKPEFELAGLWLPTAVANQMLSRKAASKYTLLTKLAEEEKEEKDTDGDDAFKREDSEENDIADKLKDIPLDELTSATAKEHMMLPPRSFALIVINSSKNPVTDGDKVVNAVPSKLQDIFSKILSSPEDTEDVLEDGHYCPNCSFPDPSTSRKVKDLKGDLSLNPEHVRRRIIIKVDKGDKPETEVDKEAEALSATEDRMAEVIAKEYAKYQLALLASTKELGGCTGMVLAQNRVG
jgi:hypothetical protein